MYNRLLTLLEDVSIDGSKHPLIVKGARADLEKLSVYYNKSSPVMMAATYVDPRFKMRYFVDSGWNSGAETDNAFNGTEENLIETRVIPA